MYRSFVKFKPFPFEKICFSLWFMAVMSDLLYNSKNILLFMDILFEFFFEILSAQNPVSIAMNKYFFFKNVI